MVWEALKLLLFIDSIYVDYSQSWTQYKIPSVCRTQTYFTSLQLSNEVIIASPTDHSHKH